MNMEIKKMFKTEKHNGVIIVVLAVFLIFALLFASSLKYNQIGLVRGLNYNILIYVLVIAVSLMVCVLTKLLIFFIPDNEFVRRIKIVVFCLSACLSMVFINLIYHYETVLLGGESLKELFLREKISHILFSILMLLFGYGIYVIIRKDNNKEASIFKMLISIVLSLFCAIMTYAPNFFRNGMWGIYHLHAYTNSIVNVANLQPYDNIRSSIYGHYGLIYLPFVKILGNNMYAVELTITLFTFIMYMATFYVLSKLVKNRLLYAVTAVAIASMSFTYFSLGQYYQVLPHRFLFLMLSLALIVFEEENILQLRNKKFIEITFGIISVIFNLEMGGG